MYRVQIVVIKSLSLSSLSFSPPLLMQYSPYSTLRIWPDCQLLLRISDATFGCSGAYGGQRSSPTAGQQCCDDGFLAYVISGEGVCTILCSGKL